MRTQFLGGAYQSRSTPLAGQTLVNLFYEPGAPGSAEEGMFYGSPGLRLFVTVGTGPIRGQHEAFGYAWIVSGAELYRVSAAGVAQLVCSIGGAGRVTVDSNATQVVVMHTEGWRVVTAATLAFVDVANAPKTAQGVYLDGRHFFPNENGTYGWTALENAASIDPLDFASAEADTDGTIAVFADHREALLFGTKTFEVAQTSGDADMVLTRTAAIEQGCAAKYSIAKADNTFFFIGRNETGQGAVFRADGYNPIRISTHALETAFAGYEKIDPASIANAFAYCYQQNGHTFYAVTVPGQATWAYDVSTQRWTNLAYRDPATGTLQPHRANAYCFLSGAHLVGDRDNGNVYVLDLDTYTDNGDIIHRERAWSVIESLNKWIRHDRLELIAEMGVGLDGGSFPGTLVLEDENGAPLTDEEGNPLLDDSDVGIASTGGDPKVLLDWSDTGCKTWSNAREIALGRIGQFKNRGFTRRLGRSRNRVYRIRISEPVKVALYSVNLDAQAGSR